MMLALLAASAGAPAPVAPADAWARCLWRSVPTSAANWIDMPPEHPPGFQSQSQFLRLKFRLRSACWDQFMPKAPKPGLLSAEPFDESRIREALTRTRPTEMAADRVDPDAWVCQAYKGGRLVAEYFTASAGMRAKLQNAPGAGVSRMDCNYISADGSLRPDA